MMSNVNKEEYKQFLEWKIDVRKNKIFLSLEKEFMQYLATARIVNGVFETNNDRNFTAFFTRILKNVFFASMYKKLNKSFFHKIEAFQEKSIETFRAKKFKKVVLISDKKVNKFDPGINGLIKTVIDDWKANLVFRSLPPHDRIWLTNNIVHDINKDLFEKAIENVIQKFPYDELQNKYNDLKTIPENNLKHLYQKFVDTKVWLSYEKYIRTFELLGDQEITEKLQDIYNCIDDETLLLIYNNESENTLFDYMFNFENELFNYINDKKNVSIVIVAEKNVYKNTFLGLLSLTNIESLDELNQLDLETSRGESTIDFSDITIDDDSYSNTIQLFADKKSIIKAKGSKAKTPRAKRKPKEKKHITDLTKTIALTQEKDNVAISNNELTELWSDHKTERNDFQQNVTTNFEEEKTKTIEDIKQYNDDLVEPKWNENNLVDEKINQEIKNVIAEEKELDLNNLSTTNVISNSLTQELQTTQDFENKVVAIPTPTPTVVENNKEKKVYTEDKKK